MQRSGQPPLQIKVIPVVTILFWVIMTALLVSRHYGSRTLPAAPEKPSLLSPGLAGEQWFGIYLRGEKIGHVSRTVASVVEADDVFYDIAEEMDLNLKVMDRVKNIRSTMQARHTRDMKLLTFSARILSDTAVEIRGSREDGSLKITMESNGRRSTASLNLDQDPSLNLAVIPRILKTGLNVGKTIRMPLFDPFTRRMEDMRIDVAGREAVISRGVSEDAYKLNAFIGDIHFSFWITETGEVLRQESPLGFVLIRETRETAQKKEVSSVDLTSYLSVPFPSKLPPAVRYLRIRLSGIALDGLELDGGRQHLKGNIIEIRQEDLSNLPKKDVSDNVPGAYLADTPLIQAKDQRIMTLAGQITGSETSVIGKAEAINTWVYRNVRKSPALTVPDALEVLETMRGDCNEHAVLFTALARAAGVPARIAVGLVYKEGAFYYHAWPEFFAEQWIAADPTFGQFPADASHIRLLTGDLDRQMRILRVIGAIKIEGVEHR